MSMDLLTPEVLPELQSPAKPPKRAVAPASPSQTKRRVAMIVAVLMTLFYLGFRGFFTLNLSSPAGVAMSLILYTAEWYGALLMFLFFFQIWDVHSPAPVSAPSGMTVDVLIPTYNEDPQLLRGTISAALNIDYPHRTYVLDDGNRQEVRELCQELGAEYIVRPTNAHAKAGNLNHALRMTDGEFVVIFDADHVSERHFIDRLVGYFAQDERLGFVQTPHAFYNFDAFQGVLDYKRGHYWEEGMLFYNVTQPGKNRWNGVSFCGSAAIFRRKALEEVGLIATESITEDMLTGLRMHAKGWKSLFVNERLIAAMAAEDITSFNTQRLRWGEGNLGIFAIDNPLTIKGLTLAQRLCYLGSMLSWTTGVQKLLIYSIPMVMLLTDVAPVNAMTWQLALVVSVYLMTIWTGVKIAGNGYAWLLGIEMTQMACFWTQVRATWRAAFKRRKAKFIVTAKRGRQSNNILRQVAPQIAYVTASVIAITWALTRYLLDLSTDLTGLTIGSALLIVNSYMAWVVIQRALHSKNRRSSWRHPVALHVDYYTKTENDVVYRGQCVTRDINEGGVGLVTFEPLPEHGILDLTITAAGRAVACRGEVRSQVKTVQVRSPHTAPAQAYVYGVKFLDLDTDQLEQLWWMGAQFAVGLHYERFSGGQFGLGSIKDKKLPGCKDELTIEMPITMMMTKNRWVCGVTETLGPESMTLLLPEGMNGPDPVHVEMATPNGTVELWGEIVDSKVRTIAGCEVRDCRFHFGRFLDMSQHTLQATLSKANSKELASVIRSTPDRRPPETMRPAALVMSTTGIAAALVIGSIIFFQHDSISLARAEAGRVVSEYQLNHLLGMVHRFGDQSQFNEDHALRLRSLMGHLDRPHEVSELDDIFARTPVKSIEGRSLKAESLQNLHRLKEADEVFTDVLANLDQHYDDRARKDVILAAARNASNLGDLPLAIRRFEKLSTYGPLNSEARLEYAGVLGRAGQGEKAARLLEEGTPTLAELRLLATIYSSDKKYPQALATYERILNLHPEDPAALRGLADNSYWSHNFAKAAAHYRTILKQHPEDAHVEELLADVLLFDKQYQASVEEYAKLLDQFPKRTDLWDGFLMAVAGSKSLRPADQTKLETIYKQRNDRKDEAFLLHLLNAISEHGPAEQVVPLLEKVVEQKPDDADLRLRLADALHNAGRFAEADVQFNWLLDHMPPPQSVQHLR